MRPRKRTSWRLRPAERERLTTTRLPLLQRPPGDGGQTGVAGISTTPAQPPAPSGLRSKGHMVVVVVNISRSRKAPLFAKPRPSSEARASAGVEKAGAAASSSPGPSAIDERIETIKAEYWWRKRLAPLARRLCRSSRLTSSPCSPSCRRQSTLSLPSNPRHRRHNTSSES